MRAVNGHELELSSFRDGFECVAGGRALLIPAHSVAQVIEYDVVPLPLSRAHVSGLGVHGGDIVVSLRLDDEPRRPGRRPAIGILLNASHGRARFALEVEEVLSIVSARRAGRAISPWLLSAMTTDRRTLPWLVVERMLADLGVSRSR